MVWIQLNEIAYLKKLVLSRSAGNFCTPTSNPALTRTKSRKSNCKSWEIFSVQNFGLVIKAFPHLLHKNRSRAWLRGESVGLSAIHYRKFYLAQGKAKQERIPGQSESVTAISGRVHAMGIRTLVSFLTRERFNLTPAMCAKFKIRSRTSELGGQGSQERQEYF